MGSLGLGWCGGAVMVAADAAPEAPGVTPPSLVAPFAAPEPLTPVFCATPPLPCFFLRGGFDEEEDKDEVFVVVGALRLL